MMHVLLAVGMIGLATSTTYTVLAIWAALRFARRRRVSQPIATRPAVSLLKPLHGWEPGLEKRLESFFQQQYPHFEILFCARSHSDPALTLARSVAARFPGIPARFLTSGEPPYANAKVWSLEILQDAAQYEILVVSDSDVSVAPDYLHAVVAPLSEAQNGMVTCLYRGVASPESAAVRPTLWSILEAVGMSVELASGVLVAEMLEGMNFALGPTMAVRRDSLEQAGGFRALGNYHGDDFMLGRLIARTGHKVVLSTHAVEHHILNLSLASSVRHQIRWMRGTRFYRPKGHPGTALTFAVPFALLAAVACVALQQPRYAMVLLCGVFATRVALAATLGSLVVRDAHPWRRALFYPLRDLFGFFLWIGSYSGNEVVWRDEMYRLLPGGLMQRREALLDSSKRASVPATLGRKLSEG